MKAQLHFRAMLTFTLALMGLSLFAEDIIFAPSELTPADTGYFINGVLKDKDGDGIEESFFNLCYDEYGDSHHWEFGVQQNFTYGGAMIMPTCYPKNWYPGGDITTPTEPEGGVDILHAEGYIELTKSKIATDSTEAELGYILTPAVSGLSELYLELSADQSGDVYFWIEYTTDGGTTWEDSYIEDFMNTKDGVPVTYTSESHLEFEEMINTSQTTPVQLRIMSKPTIEGIYRSARVKVHYVKVTADGVGINNTLAEDITVNVLDRTLSASNGQGIEVYNMLGQMMGAGKTVNVNNGIYIVRTSNGQSQRVFVQK